MNQFGKILRQERKDLQLTLGDLAQKLGISVPYLSQIETGAKPVQEKLVEKIIRQLGLIGSDAMALRRAAAASQTEFSIRLSEEANDDDRFLASQLATGFARLSPNAKAKLRSMMKDERRG